MSNARVGSSFPSPEHMNVAARNRRLYDYLKGLGLVVSPLRAPDRPEDIDCMLVSVDLPRNIVEVTGLQPSVASPDVLAPVERDEVRDVIGSPLGARDNVVTLPTKV